MSTPCVSILLPVRNEEALLPTALRSILRQTSQDWELIAVDDGSSDETPALLDRAASEDPRIRVIHRPPEGLVPALNAGLKLCRAALVARMDGDDVCHPQRLAIQTRHMREHPATTLVSCQIRHIPRPAIQAGLLAYEQWQNSLLDHSSIMRDLFVESPFAHPSVLFRKQAILDVGGYVDRGWAEDYDLWLRLAENGAQFARIPETLLYWRDRPERLTRTGAHCTQEAFRACKIHYLQRSFLKGEQRVTLWGAGIEGKAWRKALQTEGVDVACWIEIDQRKIGQIIHQAPVIGNDRLTEAPGKILVTVGSKGARAEVRETAAVQGLVEGQDFICVT
jgi:glycosyltransferase involved in cell wall biosynthesis